MKNQMKLAQNMIADAFPDQKRIEEHLDFDLIEKLLDTHLKQQINTKDYSEKNNTAKKNRFTGVDLIEPIQDMRGSNEPNSPESSNSGGHLSLNESSFQAVQVQVISPKISQLQAVIEKLVTEHSQMQFELDDFKSQNGLLRRDMDLLQKRKESRDHLILEQERQLICLKLLLEGKDEEIAKFNWDDEKVKEHEVDLLQKKVRMLADEISSKEERIRTLSQRVESMTHQLQSVVEKLISKNAESQFELDDWKSQNSSLRRDMAFLKLQKESREQMILEKERQLIGLKLLLEERQTL